MKNVPYILTGFAAGFAVATIMGLAVVVPMARDAERSNIDSDVHRGVQIALDAIDESARAGDRARTAAQVRVFKERFALYRAGGPPPADWWQDVIATTRPAGEP